MALEKDQKVIDFMFDPFLVEYHLSDQISIKDVSQTEDRNKCENLMTPEQVESKKLELKGIELANQNRFQEALEYFHQALILWPKNASGFNNRAQVLRLLNRIEDAQTDLNQAILLSDGNNKNMDDQVARQAYCQRALIHLLNENKELGLKDMSRSADLGNRFARSYMAKINPYAALCNQMLLDMFEKFNKKSLL